jgi:hypothetical protein
MTRPPGYVSHWQEPDGVWCVEVRRPNGKRTWHFGATESIAMQRAVDSSRGA